MQVDFHIEGKEFQLRRKSDCVADRAELGVGAEGQLELMLINNCED